ncbi:alpha/beta hydrolase [Spirosoma flavum]|uniref:Alpha/beta hydrolase n=1 Tax=Spirosoma flavum TaxID=2048557 RepID=A0ABW6APM1_9BACT
MKNKSPFKVINCGLAGSLLLLILSLASCTQKKTSETGQGADTSGSTMSNDSSMAGKLDELKPKGPKPAWAPSILPAMQVVLKKLASYGYQDKPIYELPAKEARLSPTPTMAVMAVMKDHNIMMPAPKVDTAGQQIPVGEGQSIHARIYTPKIGQAPFPVIVYYHGGGWVIADIDTYNASAQALAEQVGAVVVSVGYRLAPEHKFPTQQNDAFAAYQWVLNNAQTIKGDPKRVAVAGESAGGNLAANVSIMARDKKIALPRHQLLVYPIADNDVNSASYTRYASAKPLDKPMMEYFFKQTLSTDAQRSDPRIALVKANLQSLPGTTLIAAELDPLQTEGKLLADKLQAAGVTVTYKRYDGVTHEFFGMSTVPSEAKQAQTLAADELKKALK